MARKRIKTFNEMKYLLKKEMERGRLLDARRIPRQIRKTSLLKEIAERNQYLVVEKDSTIARLFNKTYCENKENIFISVRELIYSPNRNIYKGLLLDESISLEDEKYLRKKYNVIGGFSSNYFNPNFQFESWEEEYFRTGDELILYGIKNY